MTTARDEMPRRLWRGDPTPELAHLDDDWFRFYGSDPGSLHGTVAYEVHEMCNRDLCAYRDEPCKWHPESCTCSMGACQVTIPRPREEKN